MDKNEILEVVERVRSRRGEESEMLDAVVNYLNGTEGVSYDGVFKLLDKLKSPKLGGKAIYTNKAIEFLKLELKSENKRKTNK